MCGDNNFLPGYGERNFSQNIDTNHGRLNLSAHWIDKSSRQAHDVVLTLTQRCLDVNNVVTTLKRRHVLTELFPTICLSFISFIIHLDFGSCNAGEMGHGSYCYEFNSNEIDWESAKTDCQSKNGDLASIHSSSEQAFLAMKAEELGKEMWLGKSLF